VNLRVGPALLGISGCFRLLMPFVPARVMPPRVNAVHVARPPAHHPTRSPIGTSRLVIMDQPQHREPAETPSTYTDDALNLELTDPGFDPTVLSEFRTRLMAGQAEQLLLDALLMELRARGLLKARGRQCTDSTHVLAALRMLNRLERVGETMRHALNSLAVVAPGWLRAQVPPEWFERYGPRMATSHLPKMATARESLAAAIGADGRRLLQAVDTAMDLPWLREVPAVQTLRQVWAEPYSGPLGPPCWRAVRDMAASADLITSPYDVGARYSMKKGLACVGYKIHFTETCDGGQPHLMTQVLTPSATTPDCLKGPTIQHELAQSDLLPRTHLLDGGYVDAELLITAQTIHQIDVVGPTFGSYSHQRRAGRGYGLSAFRIDWDAEQARCPQGQTSMKWTPGRDVSGDLVIRIRFDRATCRTCPVRQACTSYLSME
jgi:transposase